MKKGGYPFLTRYLGDRYFKQERIILYNLKDRTTGKVLERARDLGTLRYFAAHVHRQPAWITDAQDRIIERWDSERRAYIEVQP